MNKEDRDFVKKWIAFLMIFLMHIAFSQTEWVVFADFLREKHLFYFYIGAWCYLLFKLLGPLI